MGLDTNARQTFPAQQATNTVEPGGEPEFDLRRTLMLMWRFKWLIALFVALGIGVAYLSLLRITPLYTAETRVLWNVDESNVTGIDPVAQAPRQDFYQLSSQIEVLQSGRLLNRVVDELDLVEDPSFNASLRPPEGWTRWLSLSTLLSEARTALFGEGDEPASEPGPDQVRKNVVAALRGSISAHWLDGTYVLIIQMTTPDPERSAELANEMARFYILDQLETKFEETREATSWLTDRVAELQTELEAAEEAVEDYQTNTSLVSEEALAASTRQLKDLRQRADELEERRAETAAQLARVDRLRAGGDFAEAARLVGEPRLSGLADDIARLGDGAEARREQLITSFDAELARAKERMRSSMERLESQQRSVRQSIGELEERLDSQSASLVELRQLKREAEASRLIYEFFLSRLKETAVQEGVHRPDARVLTEADVPGGPSSPRRSFYLATGAGGGMLLALALALLIERLNSSFRSTEELENETGIGVIGTIPLAPVNRRRAVMQYLVDRPASSFAEAIRNLRTSIMLANVDNPPQVIMLTSALPQEGKSTCCIALAQISRALGKRTLLVECDIRRRTFRNYFELPERGGVLSVMSGRKRFEDVVHRDEASGLDILAGEETAVNAADIFASQRFAELIGEMRERYDFIFIDTPPVLAVPDARVIAKIADAVVFCVRWNQTPRETVREAVRFFAQINIRIAGLVLSQVNVSKMARYGYGNYGYYKEASKYYHD